MLNTNLKVYAIITDGTEDKNDKNKPKYLIVDLRWSVVTEDYNVYYVATSTPPGFPTTDDTLQGTGGTSQNTGDTSQDTTKTE